MLVDRIKYIFVIVIAIISVACSTDAGTSPDDPIFEEKEEEKEGTLVSATNNPTEIKGVKWRQHSDDEFLQGDGSLDWWLNMPDAVSKENLLKSLVANNVNSIVMRVDDARRFKSPSEENYNKAMDDIIDVIETAKDNSMKLDFYLWARFWFERDGAPNHGSVNNGANKLKQWFTTVLNKAKSAGVLDDIKGIILVETNTDRIEDVKAYAVATLDAFNANSVWNDAEGNPFFHNKTLIAPGSGFGLDFRNIGNDNGKFFEDIQGKCKNFAFQYKYMRGAHETVTFDDYYNVTIGGEKWTWDDMETNSASFTKEDRASFLNHFGATELTNYIKTYKDQYPSVANMIFWGDKWDGLSKTPPLSRQALHEILVKDNNNTGYFFNLASSETSNSSAQKFYLLDGLSASQIQGWSGLSVYDEWFRWSQNNPGY
ncbi:hypothetical protein E1J38_005935 [Seonamhaeicola sediminis]|uniref:Cellulase family glycosylhydrolase n=1 Tax=Seonamhaeicola sediminis TaxID=2528206 RepID=A0A562YFF2_9FLAO|nr:hypothetical protein [Seonamhaeicola sediminis]TWO33434.1 hypothetical protein E1J38_005935 [Seonamhaeicola sediminis]